jgi:hypothetical protein
MIPLSRLSPAVLLVPLLLLGACSGDEKNLQAPYFSLTLRGQDNDY